MSVLKIITEPNEALHQESREVRQDEIGDELRSKLSSMAETMYATGGVGLAGAQVGDLRRILVADLGYARVVSPGQIAGKYGSEMIKMINPKILWSKGNMKGPEGCLSVPTFQQSVERGNMIAVEFLNEFGDQLEMIFEDFIAVIIQHEIDHLNGVTLFTRAGKLKKARYAKKVKDGKTGEKAVGQGSDMGRDR